MRLTSKLLAMALALTMLMACFTVASAEEAIAPYQVGDTMEDFTVTLSDGTVTSLSAMLAEKKMVLINFWTSWCGPCKSEFPYMQAAYDKYADQVGIVALTMEPEDTDEVVKQYKVDNKLPTLPMGVDNGLSAHFTIEGWPTSIVVDRFGTICLIEAGSTDAFETLFAMFTAEDYTSSILLTDGMPGAASTVENPTSEALSAAINVPGGSLAFSCKEDDQYAWPFVPDMDGTCVVASNTGVNKSDAIVKTTVTANAGDVLAFDCFVSSEQDYDWLLVEVDGQRTKVLSGEVPWGTVYVPFKAAGEHEVTFTFAKDDMEGSGKDVAALKNVQVLTGDAAAAAIATLPVVPQVLAADELELSLVTDTAREVVILDPSGQWDEGYSDLPIYVVGSNTATVRAMIGEDINAEFAAVSDAYNATYLTKAPHDDEAFTLTCDVYGVADDGYGYNFVTLVADNFDSSSNYTQILLFATEQDMNYFLPNVVGLEGASWMYADGSQPSTTEMAVPPAQETENSLPEGYAQYTITFTDVEGNPVSGVLAQVCDESTCNVLKSDETGVVTFTGTCYAYEVHVLSVPAQYADVEGTFTMAEDGATPLAITLTKE